VEVLSNPNLVKAIEAAFQETGIDISQYTVGSEANSINPETGYPEFLFGSRRRRRRRRARRRARADYLRQRDEAKAKFDADMAEFARLGTISKRKSEKAMGAVRAGNIKFKKDIKHRYAQLKREGQDVVGISSPAISSPTSKKLSKRKYKRITKIARQGQSSKRPA
jgi:hypothetical protein